MQPVIVVLTMLVDSDMLSNFNNPGNNRVVPGLAIMQSLSHQQ